MPYEKEIQILSELRSEYNCFDPNEREYYHALSEAIRSLKTERHGHWISHDYDFAPAESTQECSVCHKEQPIYMVDDNYCPYCGAKMDRERKEE